MSYLQKTEAACYKAERLGRELQSAIVNVRLLSRCGQTDLGGGEMRRAKDTLLELRLAVADVEAFLGLHKAHVGQGSQKKKKDNPCDPGASVLD